MVTLGLQASNIRVGLDFVSKSMLCCTLKVDTKIAWSCQAT